MDTPDIKFLLVESPGNPLNQVSEKQIESEIIDPFTGKPYKGVVLEGIFACLEVLNNNNRIYTVEDYLLELEKLKRQIHSPKGVYGELEHPKGYAIDANNVSHKLLDVWYIPKTKTVWGRILLLNTEKGLQAQQILRSGGQLAISARAAGKEIKNSDGTLTAKIGMLVTYDIVYHPGFSDATLNFVKLYESFDIARKAAHDSGIEIGYSFKIYDDQIQKLDESYNEFIEKRIASEHKSYLSWFGSQLNESQQDKKEEQKDAEKLQDNEPSSDDEIEKELEDATEEDLGESFEMTEEEELEFEKNVMFQRLNESINRKKKYSRQGASLFDGSAGFLSGAQLSEKEHVENGEDDNTVHHEQ